ncbi:hypothetical protein [Trichocoleus sp. FACHB-262]|uniref:hypothetical protein n=1 Tax=Trichocoleus sp. FACHB-262 TaxID=2692869 RepID=UPI00168A01E5|nr:hypothetical protein [Trichocoleus sp. FACHB-262]MBD2121821.1 hypothetical protein [Trichocoleus sp. FACHB-262]
MSKKLSVFKVIELYKESLQAVHSPEQWKYLFNHLNTGFLRFVATGMGFKRQGSQGKMTKHDTQRAWDFFRNLSSDRLMEIEDALYRGYDLLNPPQASRNTYGAAVKGCLKWTQAEGFYPGSGSDDWEQKCAPRMHRGRGGIAEMRLTERRGRYPQYGLRPEELTATQQQNEAAFRTFYSGYCRPRNLVKTLEASSIDIYLEQSRLFLGFFKNVYQPGIPEEQLNFDLLLPKVSEEDLEDLSRRETRKLWQEGIDQTDDWVMAYQQYINEFCGSFSPHTWAGKESALLAIAKFQYRTLVSRRQDFYQIPMITHLQDQCSATEVLREQWRRTKKSVVKQEDKWPDPVLGETALETLYKEVTEPLRLEARPHNSRKQIRARTSIAKSTFIFLFWYLLMTFPPRRQEDYRETRIALSCPIKKPEEVPVHGLYLPPIEFKHRKKNRNGQLADNCLSRVYKHAGKNYPEGVYVIDFNDYKTDGFYGRQTFIIPNRLFSDNLTFYDYMDRWLFGEWMQTKSVKAEVYRGWQREFLGKRMLLITAGRMDFDPKDHHQPLEDEVGEQYIWGYWWVKPRAGNKFCDSNLARSFSTPAHRLMKTPKRPTPHTLRYIWATWAFQKGLSDRQLESLAYMMGHSLETLKRMYDRSTHEDKIRPIQAAIDEVLLRDLEDVHSMAQAAFSLSEMTMMAKGLSQEERQQLIQQLLNDEPSDI